MRCDYQVSDNCDDPPRLLDEEEARPGGNLTRRGPDERSFMVQELPQIPAAVTQLPLHPSDTLR